MIRKSTCSLAALLVLAGATPAFATNGMNLEGYGAKSMAMGGTGSAYDTGNSAVMNNPATLGFMKEGVSEIGLGLRGLHPTVKVENGPFYDKSDATAFFMPSISYMRRDGRISWGAAMLAQGGMGTDYGSDSPIFAGGFSMNRVQVPMSGKDIRSEVGVGRIMFPVAYHLTDNTTLGASFDVVIANMDLQMDMDGDHFRDMMGGNGGTVGGSMIGSLQGAMTAGYITDINYTRFDFSNDNPFTGKARGFGTGLKFGITHKLSKQVTFGASYHTQTQLSDLETNQAKLSFSANDMGRNEFTQTVEGKIKIHNFEWPATLAAGLAFQPNDRWLIAGDVKIIDWSAVMDSFSTTFTANDDPNNGGFAGQTLDVSLDQDWSDQTVWSVGVQYMANKKLAFRAGASFANNPVPDQYLNPLFPAITTNHYTFGFGYKVNKSTRFGAAFSWAPEVEATNGDNTVISHSQTNWAVNLVHEL